MPSDSTAKDRQPDKRSLLTKAWDNSFGNWFNGNVFSGVTSGLAASSTGLATLGVSSGTKANYPGLVDALQKNIGKGGPTSTTSSKVPADAKLPNPILTPDETYKWNLPPHTWSLPIEPASINDTVSNPFGTSNFLHSTRRGRIFYCAGYTGSEVKASQNESGKLTTGAKKPPSHHYGFQFMWNPETYTQNTAVNMELTYDASDPYAALTSLVAANATVDFTIRLDRTNDFACFNDIKHSKYDRDKSYSDAAQKISQITAEITGAKKPKWVPYSGATVDQALAAKYYQTGQPLNSATDFQKNMQSKLNSLMTQGTMADLEYLFRAINGDGFNVLGLDTSNIGYLMPTIVRLDLGPQKWVGIIKNIGVTHLAFTQDMIPIRTDVTLSLDVRATTKQLSTASVTTPTATATTDPTTKK